MIINLPKLGPVEFSDDLSEQEFQRQLQALSKKYDFKLPKPEVGLGTLFKQGLMRGVGQTGIALGDVGPAMVASFTGFPEYAEQQMQEAKESQAKLQQQYPTQFQSYTKVESPYEALQYGAETLGEVTPSIGASLISGGIGGLGARALATRGAMAAAEKFGPVSAAERLAIKGVGEAAGRKGMYGGAFFGSFAQNAPEVFQNIYEETGEFEPVLSGFAGGISAILDSFVPASILNKFGSYGRLKIIESLAKESGAAPKVWKAIGKEATKAAVAEGITESAQEAISAAAEEIAGSAKGLFEPENIQRFKEAFVKGAIGGAGFGSISGLRRGLVEREVYRKKLGDETPPAPPTQPAPPVGEVPTTTTAPLTPEAEEQAIADFLADIDKQAAAETQPPAPPTEGAPSVTGTDEQAGREGVGVSGEGVAGTAAAPVVPVEPSGVDVAGGNVSQPAGREAQEPGALGNFLAPEKYYYHAVRNVEDIPDILKNGLRPGTNLSANTQGQAFTEEGATVLVFRKEDVQAKQKEYQDDYVVENQPRPVGILKDTSTEEYAGQKGELEWFDKWKEREDKLEARKNAYANTMGMSREDFDKLMMQAGVRAKKQPELFKEYFEGYADNVKEMWREGKELDRILDRETEREAGSQRPVTTKEQVLEKYAQYGLPVEPFRADYNEDTNQVEVKYDKAAPAPAAPKEEIAALETQVKNIGAANAEFAFNLRRQYENIKNVTASYERNVIDTLNRLYGKLKDLSDADKSNLKQLALEAFDNKIFELRERFTLKETPKLTEAKIFEVTMSYPPHLVEEDRKYIVNADSKTEANKIARNIASDNSQIQGRVTFKAKEISVREELPLTQAVKGALTPQQRKLAEAGDLKGLLQNLLDQARGTLNLGLFNPARRELALILRRMLALDMKTKLVVGTPTGEMALPVFSKFYSALGRSVEGINIKTATPQGWKDAIKGLVNKGQVKQEEVEWTAINDWLDLQEGRVSKEQVVDYLKKEGVQVEEVVLSGPRDTRDYWYLKERDGSFSVIDENKDRVDTGFDTLEEVIAEVLRLKDTQKPQGVKFKDKTLPGGENYREIILTLPAVDKTITGSVERDGKDDVYPWAIIVNGEEVNRVSKEDVAYEVLHSELSRAREKTAYKGHFPGVKNPAVHIRVNDRKDADGNRVLFVEEIQSDWGQAGREREFGTKRTPLLLNEKNPEAVPIGGQRGFNFIAEDGQGYTGFGNTVEEAREDVYRVIKSLSKVGLPIGPFVSARQYVVYKDGKELVTKNKEDKDVRHRYDNVEAAQAAATKFGGEVRDMGFQANTEGWLNLALKRIMIMAAEGGYDRVAFINGEQSADRYDLSRVVDKLNWITTKGGSKYVQLTGISFLVNKKGIVNADPDPEDTAIAGMQFIGRKLSSVVGKELAERIISEPEGSLRGLNLKVGGEGMEVFYDKIVPIALKKLLPKLGGGQIRVVEMWDVGGAGGGVGFDVTPEMRSVVETKGVPLFYDNAGSYDPPTDTITLDPNNGMNVHTVVHEGSHAVLSHTLDNPSHPVTKEVTNLYNQMKASSEGAYGATNVQEFAAEAWGNPEFREHLKQFKPTGQKLDGWKRLINALRRLFGFGSHYETAYDKIDNLLSQIMSPAPESRMGEKLFAEAASRPNAANVVFDWVDSGLKKIPSVITPQRRASMWGMLEKLAVPLRAGVYKLLTASQLGEVGSRYFGNNSYNFARLLNEMEGFKEVMRERLEPLHNRHTKHRNENPERHALLHKLITDATLENVAPYPEAKAKYDKTDKAIPWANLHGRFVELTPEEQKLYRDHFNTFVMLREEFKKSLAQNVRELVSDRERAISTYNRVMQQLAQVMIDHYSPLYREGDYRLAYTLNGVPVVKRFETQAERLAEQESLEAQGATDIEATSEINQYTARTVPDGTMLASIMKIMKDSGANETDLDKLVQLIVSAFPETSILKSQQHRSGISGYIDDNVARVFDRVASNTVRQIANTRYRQRIRNTLNLMEQDQKKLRGDESEDAKTMFNDFNGRFEFSMNPNIAGWAQFTSSSAFYWNLGANVSSAVVQVATLPTIVYPIIAGKYGWGASWSAIKKAMALYSQSGMSREIQELTGEKSTQRAMLSVENLTNSGKAPEYQPLIEALKGYGLLTNSTARDALYSENQNDSAFGGVNKLQRNAALYGSFMFHHMERMSREVTAISTYDLELAKLKRDKPNMPETEMQQAAIREAIRITERTHGASTTLTGPALGHSNIGKVLMVFKRFAFAQYYNLFGTIFRAFPVKGADPDMLEDIRAARRQLVGIYVMATMFAGVKGVPLYWVAALAYDALRDEDEDDFDTVARKYLGELLYKGPVNYFTNTNIADRVGWADLIWRENRNDRAESSAITQYIEGILGAPLSMVNNILKGFNLISEGHLYRGIEMMLPAALKNVMKGARYGVEGANTLRGDPVMGEVSGYNAAMQILGFAPADLIKQYEENAYILRKQKAITGEEQQLLKKYYIALRQNDMERAQEIQEKLYELGEKYPELGIGPAMLNKSVKARDRISDKMYHGVTLNEKLRARLEGAASVVYD